MQDVASIGIDIECAEEDGGVLITCSGDAGFEQAERCGGSSSGSPPAGPTASGSIFGTSRSSPVSPSACS